MSQRQTLHAKGATGQPLLSHNQTYQHTPSHPQHIWPLHLAQGYPLVTVTSNLFRDPADQL